MIITKTKDYRLKKYPRYFTDGPKAARVIVTRYWLLFIPIYSTTDVLEFLSS